MPRNFDRHLNRQQRRALKAQGKWLPLRPVTAVPPSPERLRQLIESACRLRPEMARADVEMLVKSIANLGELWANDLYQVHVMRWPPQAPIPHPIVHLSIRRMDRQGARDWRHFQAIKNQIVGPECEAIELYPAEGYRDAIPPLVR